MFHFYSADKETCLGIKCGNNLMHFCSPNWSFRGRLELIVKSFIFGKCVDNEILADVLFVTLEKHSMWIHLLVRLMLRMVMMVPCLHSLGGYIWNTSAKELSSLGSCSCQIFLFLLFFMDTNMNQFSLYVFRFNHLLSPIHSNLWSVKQLSNKTSKSKNN